MKRPVLWETTLSSFLLVDMTFFMLMKMYFSLYFLAEAFDIKVT